MRTTLLLLLFFSATCSYSQTIKDLNSEEIDSTLRILRKAGDFESALPYTIRAMELAITKYGKEDSISAKKISDVGIAYYYNDDLEQAEKYYESSKNIRAKILGKKHPQYSYSLVNLAMLYEDLGNYEKAEIFYLEAVECDRNIYGKEHPFYA